MICINDLELEIEKRILSQTTFNFGLNYHFNCEFLISSCPTLNVTFSILPEKDFEIKLLIDCLTYRFRGVMFRYEYAIKKYYAPDIFLKYILEAYY